MHTTNYSTLLHKRNVLAGKCIVAEYNAEIAKKNRHFFPKYYKEKLAEYNRLEHRFSALNMAINIFQYRAVIAGNFQDFMKTHFDVEALPVAGKHHITFSQFQNN